MLKAAPGPGGDRPHPQQQEYGDLSPLLDPERGCGGVLRLPVASGRVTSDRDHSLDSLRDGLSRDHPHTARSSGRSRRKRFSVLAMGRNNGAASIEALARGSATLGRASINPDGRGGHNRPEATRSGESPTTTPGEPRRSHRIDPLPGRPGRENVYRSRRKDRPAQAAIRLCRIRGRSHRRQDVDRVHSPSGSSDPVEAPMGCTGVAGDCQGPSVRRKLDRNLNPNAQSPPLRHRRLPPPCLKRLHSKECVGIGS